MNNDSAIFTSPQRFIKFSADSLYQAIQKQDMTALKRIQMQIHHLKEKSFQGIQPDHALTTVVRELGFNDWQMARDVVEAKLRPGDDYGEFWYEPSTDVLLNHWCRNYDEALEVQKDQAGYLLPYKRHFAVVQKTYIEILGMDVDDSAWEYIHFDLAKPADLPFFRQLVLNRLNSKSA